MSDEELFDRIDAKLDQIIALFDDINDLFDPIEQSIAAISRISPTCMPRSTALMSGFRASRSA